VALPIPEFPPVMMATLFAKRFMDSVLCCTMTACQKTLSILCGKRKFLLHAWLCGLGMTV
jgi:hypothetical protein